MNPVISSDIFLDGFIIGSNPTVYSTVLQSRWKSDGSHLIMQPKILRSAWGWKATMSAIPGFPAPGKVHTVRHGITLRT